MTTTCTRSSPNGICASSKNGRTRIRSRHCSQRSSDQVLSVYEPKLLGTDRVAGIDSQVIELDPKDAYRFAYKLWADPEDGPAAARADARPGRPGARAAFVFAVQHWRPVDKAAIANGIHNTAGWTVVRPPVEPVDMEAQGWQIDADCAGFPRRFANCVVRWRRVTQGQPPIPVDQAVFSDGLAAISIFVEPVEKNTRKEGAGNSGATHVLVKRRGDFWITLLGEVPQATLQQFASAIEYKRFQVIPRIPRYDMTIFSLRKFFAAAVVAVCLPLVPHAAARQSPTANLARFHRPSSTRSVRRSSISARRPRVGGSSDLRGLPPGMDDGDMSEFFRRFFGIPMPQQPGRAGDSGGGGRRQWR